LQWKDKYSLIFMHSQRMGTCGLKYSSLRYTTFS